MRETVKRFRKIHFEVLDKGTIVEVELEFATPQNEVHKEWRNRVFDENTKVIDIVTNHLRLALNWEEGKNDKNGKKES